MVPVHDVLPGALVQVLRRAPLTPEKVTFAWRRAAGQAIDRVTMVHLRENVLHVRARDAQWKREIERAAALLRARLEPLLGTGVVRRIEVTVAAT